MAADREVRFEISGPTAMWTRPDTGAAPISYLAPTYSAAKGMFESILRLRSVVIRPLKVEICSPLVYHTYTTNYRGPLRKSKLLSSGDAYQLMATVLIDVRYRLYAMAEAIPKNRVTTNDSHAYHDIFFKRLKRGQCHDVPCLGWREFSPSYVGEFCPLTRVQEEIDDLTVPSMLHTVWDAASDGRYRPVFHSNVRVKKGCLSYVE